MKRSLTALVLAGTLAKATVATPTQADARWGLGGWGWGLGGLAVGLGIGAALASPGYGYGYPAYGYGYGYPAYSYGYAYPAYSYGYAYPAYRYGYYDGFRPSVCTVEPPDKSRSIGPAGTESRDAGQVSRGSLGEGVPPTPAGLKPLNVTRMQSCAMSALGQKRKCS